MNRNLHSILYKTLGFLGLFLGFVSRVLAQYGAPVHFIKSGGLLVSRECNTAVPNAKITLIDEASGARYVTYSDSTGKFKYHFESDWGTKFKMLIEDVDGDRNGSFKNWEGKIEDSDMGYTAGSKKGAMERIYGLNFYGILPCQVEIKNDSVKYIDVPPVRIDTLNPAKNVDPIGISEEPSLDFKLFPNPNNGDFYIELYISNIENANLWIYDHSGRLVYLENLNSWSSGEVRRIELSNPAPGNYFMIVRTVDKEIQKNFVIAE